MAYISVKAILYCLKRFHRSLIFENIGLTSSSLVLFPFLVDVCHKYKNLTSGKRKTTYIKPLVQPAEEPCDDKLVTGWYRFVGDAGTRMPTTCPPIRSCGVNFPGWLIGPHPAEGLEAKMHGRFRKYYGGCNANTFHGRFYVQAKNCGRYYVYLLNNAYIKECEYRFCSTD